jgi:hypothetical protein
MMLKVQEIPASGYERVVVFHDYYEFIVVLQSIAQNSARVGRLSHLSVQG